MSDAKQTMDPPKKDLAVKNEQALGLRGLLAQDNVKARFNEVLGKEGPVFAASVMNVVSGNRLLQEAAPKSILAAAFQAAALKLPITPGLGQAALVPYKGVAQFQIMTRGIVQLAHRSGQYKRIHLADVWDGQLVEHNEFTGEVKLDAKAKKSEKIVGYYFFFELLNGYRHEAYWSVERCLAHGKKYSQAYKNDKGPWVEMPEAMCRKTVVKNELAKWGPLSSEMRTAFTLDQAAIKDDGTPDYIDAETAEETATAYAMPKSTDAPPAAAATPAETVFAGIVIDKVTKSVVGNENRYYACFRTDEKETQAYTTDIKTFGVISAAAKAKTKIDLRVDGPADALIIRAIQETAKVAA